VAAAGQALARINADRRARRAGRRHLAGGPTGPPAGQLRPERPRPGGPPGPPQVPRRTPAARGRRRAAGPARAVPGPGHPGQLRPVLPGLRRTVVGAPAELGRHGRRPAGPGARHARPHQRRPRLPARRPRARPEGGPLRPEVRRSPPLSRPGRHHQGRVGGVAHPGRRRRPARHRPGRDHRSQAAPGRPAVGHHLRQPGRPRRRGPPLRLPARAGRPRGLVPGRPGALTAGAAPAQARRRSARCPGRTSAGGTGRPTPRAPAAPTARNPRPDPACTAPTR